MGSLKTEERITKRTGFLKLALGTALILGVAALGFQCDVEELVLARARKALTLGCDGVISSGLEAPRLRDSLGEQFLIVTPGIRPVDNRPDDDQKRVVDVAAAFRNGADYIVVGRPIRDAADPRAAALAMQATIAALFPA